ncbi:MAG TPA: Mur ligase family protein, partial [Patescibacteria group bacterium]|nr:Mur ligase family protein [Patescibacteria group bacterium]
MNQTVWEAFLITLFLIRTARVLWYLLFLWQLKEYRFDRMRIHLSTQEGRKLLFGPAELTKDLLVLALLGFILTHFTYGILLVSVLYVGIIFFEAIRFLFLVLKGQFFMPFWTTKTVTLFLSIFFTYAVILWSSGRSLPFVVILLERTLGLWIALGFGVFSVPSRIRAMIIFGLATRKIETLSHIKVIGITGSYGKSSTKSMIAQLLRSTFDVEETLENQNTTIGIASTIVRRLTPSTDIFVMEVGAYKIGEIRDSVSLVGQRLENAVITGVNEQHLQLFGSKERIEEAKYELIENLPQGKTVYVNADNPVAKRMGERAKK